MVSAKHVQLLKHEDLRRECRHRRSSRPQLLLQREQPPHQACQQHLQPQPMVIQLCQASHLSVLQLLQMKQLHPVPSLFCLHLKKITRCSLLVKIYSIDPLSRSASGFRWALADSFLKTSQKMQFRYLFEAAMVSISRPASENFVL